MVNHPTCRTLFPYTTLFRSDQRAIHRFLTTEPAELRVDDLAVSEVDPHLSPASEDPQDAALPADRSEEHTSELQSRENLVCRLLLVKKKFNGRYYLAYLVYI